MRALSRSARDQQSSWHCSDSSGIFVGTAVGGDMNALLILNDLCSAFVGQEQGNGLEAQGLGPAPQHEKPGTRTRQKASRS
jgi:hypothetical protein